MHRKIVLYALGSRGDIQPCVALGRELTARGHDVRVVASARYAGLIAAAGLDPFSLSVDAGDLINTKEGQELLASGRNPIKFLRGFKPILGPMAERLLAEMVAAAEHTDFILAPTAGAFARHLGEYHGVPGASVHYQPSFPTRAFPHPLVPQARALGRWGNRMSFELVDQLAWQVARPFLNPWRREVLGLSPVPLRGASLHRTLPALCCFSSTVVPRPRDWPSSVHLTGYWFVDEPAFEPPPELAAFLAAGPPPVYVGFGSMVPPDPERTNRLIKAALCLAGVRGLIQGDPKSEPTDDVLPVEDVPHSWLFPRVAAVVHHGGAGTTAASLRAGVPTVVCPFFSDQPYWGERVSALRAGPPPIPFPRLTVRNLAETIRRAMHDPAIRTGARRTADRLSQEAGTTLACDIIESML